MKTVLTVFALILSSTLSWSQSKVSREEMEDHILQSTRLIEADSSVYNPFYYRAKFYYFLGEISKAKKDLERVVYMHENNREMYIAIDDFLYTYMLLGWIEHENYGNTEKSIEYLKYATEINGTVSEPFGLLAEVYLVRGDTANYCIHQKSAADLSPDIEIPEYCGGR